jgi:thiamine pyrophosphokinase
MSGTCVIVTGGEPPHPHVRSRLPAGATVVAADSGLDHAEDLGLAVDLVVGDLDSVSKEALDRARTAGIPIEEHPAAKDQTDLELAIDLATATGASRLVVVSGGGGRLDHLLAGLLALAVPAAQGCEVEAYVGAAHVVALHGPGRAVVHGRPGELLTLLPVGGRAIGVVTEGLRFPLDHEPLTPGSGRGVSNELLTSEAAVSLDEGDLLVLRPEALEVPPCV